MKLIPKMKLWLNTEEAHGALGDGKFRLLKTIEETGSLSAAADTLKISYRKAWGSLKKTEEYLGVKLIDKTRGGTGGGKTTLTSTGKKLLATYAKFNEKMQMHLTTTYKETLENLFDEEF